MGWWDESRWTGRTRGFGWCVHVLPQRNQRAPVRCITAAVSLTHTHTLLLLSFIALWFIHSQTVTSETYTTKYQTTHIFHHKQFTVPHDSCSVLWMDIHRKIYFFVLLQKAGLYLAVFIDSGLTHYTVLFSISPIHCKSPDTTTFTKKEKEKNGYKTA